MTRRSGTPRHTHFGAVTDQASLTGHEPGARGCSEPQQRGARGVGRGPQKALITPPRGCFQTPQKFCINKVPLAPLQSLRFFPPTQGSKRKRRGASRGPVTARRPLHVRPAGPAEPEPERGSQPLETPRSTHGGRASDWPRRARAPRCPTVSMDAFRSRPKRR